jgi:hypothetical protein
LKKLFGLFPANRGGSVTDDVDVAGFDGGWERVGMRVRRVLSDTVEGVRTETE